MFSCLFLEQGEQRMTKEELENRKLERRAKEWFIKDKGGSIIQSLVNLIKEFTEPREKRIADLEAENDDIYDALNTQSLRTSELEAQIEKMKCCCNCKHSRTEYEHCETDELEKWEIKEK